MCARLCVLQCPTHPGTCSWFVITVRTGRWRFPGAPQTKDTASSESTLWVVLMGTNLIHMFRSSPEVKHPPSAWRHPSLLIWKWCTVMSNIQLCRHILRQVVDYKLCVCACVCQVEYSEQGAVDWTSQRCITTNTEVKELQQDTLYSFRVRYTHTYVLCSFFACFVLFIYFLNIKIWSTRVQYSVFKCCCFPGGSCNESRNRQLDRGQIYHSQERWVVPLHHVVTTSLCGNVTLLSSCSNPIWVMLFDIWLIFTF